MPLLSPRGRRLDFSAPTNNLGKRKRLRVGCCPLEVLVLGTFYLTKYDVFLTVTYSVGQLVDKRYVSAKQLNLCRHFGSELCCFAIHSPCVLNLRTRHQIVSPPAHTLTGRHVDLGQGTSRNTTRLRLGPCDSVQASPNIDGSQGTPLLCPASTCNGRLRYARRPGGPMGHTPRGENKRTSSIGLSIR